MTKTDVYRNGRIHVRRKLCDTCIFRPGNLMDLQPGRVEQMTREASENDGCIPCHKTTHKGGGEAVCRGFFNLNSSMPLRLAVAFNKITFQD
jgi:hypothetical protein